MLDEQKQPTPPLRPVALPPSTTAKPFDPKWIEALFAAVGSAAGVLSGKPDDSEAQAVSSAMSLEAIDTIRKAYTDVQARLVAAEKLAGRGAALESRLMMTLLKIRLAKTIEDATSIAQKAMEWEEKHGND